MADEHGCAQICAPLLVLSDRRTRAAQDAEECIRLEPGFVKGYIRKGGLELVMKDFDAALVTFGQGLKVDPANQELKDGERKAVYALNQVAADTPPLQLLWPGGRGWGLPPPPPRAAPLGLMRAAGASQFSSP